MPHDKNGSLIQKGDRVLIECEVQEVSESLEYCNIKVKPVIPMPGINASDCVSWINTRQALLLGKGEAALKEPSADE